MIKPDRRILPAAQATLIDQRGVATPPMYDFMRRVVEATAITPELLQQMQDLLAQFAALQAAIADLDLSLYTQRARNETISGQWTFLQQIQGADGTPEQPEYSFSDDDDSGIYRIIEDNIGISTGAILRWDIDTERIYQTVSQIVDNNSGLKVRVPTRTTASIELTNVDDTVDANLTLGLWEVNDTHESLALHGFRFFMEGAPVGEAYLKLFRHDNSDTGSEVWRVTRTASGIDFFEQVRALDGTGSAPGYSFTSDPNSGIVSTAADTVGISAGGAVRLSVSTSAISATQPFRGQAGTTTAPTYSFSTNTNTGMRLSSANVLAFTVNGTDRALLTGTALTMSVVTQGPSGTAGGPAYAFSGDPNTGPFSAGPDIYALATGGNERFRIGASGEWGLGGANYGTLGQVLTSNGSSAAPTWEDPPSASLQTFITEDDETGTLPNSRQLIAGSNITIDTTTPGEIEISASGGGFGGDIAAEILADSPTGYWKLDEASGNFADSSGNGNTLTASGTIRYQQAALNKADPTTFHAYFTSGAGASIAGSLGVAVPMTGDWTIEGIALFPASGAAPIFGIGNTGETTAENFQAMLYRNSTGTSVTMEVFWEDGAGTNRSTTMNQTLPLYEPRHYVAVKDGTANTITFFVNGLQYGDPLAYANEPSGGTSVFSGIGAFPGQSSAGCALAHVAFYDGIKLSAARIAAHASAAGY